MDEIKMEQFMEIDYCQLAAFDGKLYSFAFS